MESSRFLAGPVGPLACSLLLAAAVGFAGCAGTVPVASPAVSAPEAQAPAYLVVLGTVKDRKAFMEGYAAKLPPLYQKYGGSYVAIGGKPVVLEGQADISSFVLARWPSMEAAQAFWTSPEYDALRRTRIEQDWGEFTVLLLPGLATPVQAAPGVTVAR